MARTRRHASRARSAVFSPLGDPGRAARVEQRLAEAIRSGLLADGERLPSESDLAAMLGVAPVTAREALVSLRAQNLVTTVRGRGGGSFVTRPGPVDEERLGARLAAMSRVELRDRCVVYRVIVAGCAELAAGLADASDVVELESLLVPEDEPEVGRWRHADSELNLSIAALTQSARMTREMVRQEADFGAVLRLPFAEAEFRSASADRRHRLVAAIRAHDGQAARTVMHEQVDDALARVVERHAEVRR